MGASPEGGRDDDLFGATSEMLAGTLDARKDSRRFNDVVGAHIPPLDIFGIKLLRKGNWISIDDYPVAARFYITLENAVGRVVFEDVFGVLRIIKARIVDGCTKRKKRLETLRAYKRSVVRHLR